jgi:hypothetical protein
MRLPATTYKSDELRAPKVGLFSGVDVRFGPLADTARVSRRRHDLCAFTVVRHCRWGQ